MRSQGGLEQIPQEVVKQISELETRIMTDIVERIHKNGFSSASSDWQITRLQQLGESDQNIQKMIRQALGDIDVSLDKIFSDTVYEEYYGHARSYKLFGREQIPFEQNDQLQELIGGIRQQTGDTFRNMTKSMGFAIKDPVTGKITYSPLMKFYQDTLDAAMWDLLSGGFDFNTILNRTVSRMTTSGIRWIDYDSGNRNRVDVAARRAILTGFRQIQGKINEQVAQELETDRYEVSAHVGARPTHQPWQGKIWTMQQLIDVCGLETPGMGTGLCGWNCYHDYQAFPPGSIRTYTDEQLEQMIKEDNTPKEYKGKKYTTYEALQKQRYMERCMRKTRQEIELLKSGEAPEQEIILKKAKYQGQLQQYSEFSKTMGLPEEMKRVYQDGLRGKFTPTKTEQKILEESVINDKIKADMKATGLRGEINLKPEIPDVSKLSFDEYHINQERQHNVTELEAKSYIQNAVFSTTKWKGKFTNYYSCEGAAFVDNEAQHIKTAFKKEQYDEKVTAAMEVLKNGRT